jgi:hypothetical protein
VQPGADHLHHGVAVQRLGGDARQRALELTRCQIFREGVGLLRVAIDALKVAVFLGLGR